MKNYRRAGFGVALAACLVPGVAQTATAQSPAAPPPTDPVILDLDAHPAFDWSVPARYDASWAAWNATTDSYDRNVINPRAWSVNLTMCASRSRYRVTGYTVAVQQLGTTWQRTYSTPTCTLSLRNALPAQGTYAATITMHTNTGLARGVSVPLRRIFAITDRLIVSLGDSLASGEGNPDRNGSYVVSTNWLHKVTSVRTRRAATWKDANCHRSAVSGPARAAKAIEDANAKTSVTFVSLACTGAQLLHLTNLRHKGVPPQAVSAARAIAAHDGLPARTIDTLIVSAGVNDLHFADIIERCASNWQTNSPSCVTAGGIDAQLRRLPSTLTTVLKGLRTTLPTTRSTYLSAYPDDPFRGGGCGALGLPHTGISAAEGAAMHRYAVRLNASIATAARNAPGNVTYLDLNGVPFAAHPYCAAVRWFVHYKESFDQQGDKLGTAHPNELGLRAYANQIVRRIGL